MPAALSLEQLVRDNLYRNARHRDLLETAPTLPWPQLAELQSAYVRTEHPLERAEIAREFQRRVRTLTDDEDEKAARAAEEAELEAIVNVPPVEVRDDEIGRSLDRWHRALVACDMRNGAARDRRATWREIGRELGCSASTARRLGRSVGAI